MPTKYIKNIIRPNTPPSPDELSADVTRTNDDDDTTTDKQDTNTVERTEKNSNNKTENPLIKPEILDTDINKFSNVCRKKNENEFD